MRWCSALLLLLIFCLRAEAPKKYPGQRLTEINSRIEELKRQLDRLQEEKRQLLGLPESLAPALKQRSGTNQQQFIGPRDGRYHYSSTGRKVYEHRK